MQGFLITSLAHVPDDAWGFVVMQLPPLSVIVPCESEEESVKTRSALQSNGGTLSIRQTLDASMLASGVYVYIPHGLPAPDELSSKRRAWVDAARAVAAPAELQIQAVRRDRRKERRSIQQDLEAGIIRSMKMLAALPPVAAPIVRIVFPALRRLLYRLQMRDIRATPITSPELLPQDAWGFLVRQYAPSKFFISPCESQEQAERHRRYFARRGQDANVYQTAPDEIFRAEQCWYSAYLERNVSPKRAAWIEEMRAHERQRLRREMEASPWHTRS
jgi:hypothetical protein